MDFYLFPALSSDKTIRQLLALRESGSACIGVFPRLLAFSGKSMFSDQIVREYVLRRMLASPPRFWDGRSMRPYLQRDMELVYDCFFRTDWDTLCRAAGMLPFPNGPAPGAPGEEGYKNTICRMVQASGADELCRMADAFFESYRDEDEAMYRAFRWNGELTGIPFPDTITFDDLDGLQPQKEALVRNTGAFLHGLPANDILLVGGSGTGKSSCVKATLNRFAGEGLGLVELSRGDLVGLPRLMELLTRQKKKYLVFIDDLSFENADQSYLELKVALDGQVAARPGNVLIYATSNRRHIIRESWKDREGEEDLHQNDTLHEKMSLSERFGIRLYFPILSQEEYFGIVRMLLARHGVGFTDELAKQAAAWAIANNGRSGRSAKQFAAHVASGAGPQALSRTGPLGDILP